MITITTSTLFIIVISLVGLTGWILGYREYDLRIKDANNYENKILIVRNDMKDAISQKEEMHHKALKDLKRDHEEVVEEYKEQVISLTNSAEEDLLEVENLIKAKIEEIEKVYKETLEDQNESLELYEKYIRNFDAIITLSGEKLIELDAKGSFKSDDEIGFFFKGVQDLQTLLNKFKIEKEELDEEQTN